LLDESKDVNTKALAVLRIADKWAENSINNNNNNSYSQPHSLNDLIVDKNSIMKKSPSNMSSPKHVNVEVSLFTFS
jgi:hypothetical protein